jgi:CRP/FNR family nitrogen fixation transcriptional regulator
VARKNWQTNPRSIGLLKVAGVVVQIPEGREIFAEGDDTDLFYKVASSVVRICKFLKDGRRQIVAFHMAGESFGFELGACRQFTAEAVDECTLVCYSRRSVELLAQKDQTVSRQLLRHAMQSLVQAQAHSLLLAKPRAAERIASFLLDWQSRSSNGAVIQLAMSRQEIGDHLALAMETVSRILSQFEREGLIAMPRTRELHLLNTKVLEEMAASK